MSRKPVDQQQPTECRQAIWSWIRDFSSFCAELCATEPKPFTAKDIDVRLDISTINDYLTGLVKAGYLAALKGSKPAEPVLYRLINDTGHDAPRVRRNGTPVTMGQGRQQMWNAMQVLKVFTPRDLAFNATTDTHTVAESEAKTYCATLCKAGYLVGHANQRYSLVPAMWTGPHPPQIQRTKQVYDPNLKRVVWSRIEGGAE